MRLRQMVLFISDAYPELKPLFEALDAPHKKFHQSGGLVIKALQQGNVAEADRLSLHTQQILLPDSCRFTTRSCRESVICILNIK